MRRDDPNLPALRVIAEALGDLREQVVFVGGAVTGLLVTDPLVSGIRATRDVDAVVAAGRGEFQRIEARVAAAGFERDPDSGVICRWVHRPSGVLFDLMSAQPEVMGFTNRWYPFAIATADRMDLGGGLSIRVASAVAFVAMKLEAFADRGAGFPLASHDLEDVLNIVDGRDELIAELAEAPEELVKAVGEWFGSLLADADFINALPGLVSDPERADIVQMRLADASQLIRRMAP